MHVSAKTEYACIAALELASSFESGKPVRIRDIAEANGIPARFLVQILLQLKGAGLVGSTRGAAGGYQLARDPETITLGQVMAVSDGQTGEPTSSATKETPTSRALLDTLREVSAIQQKMLDSVTLADLVTRMRGQADNMYYI